MLTIIKMTPYEAFTELTKNIIFESRAEQILCWRLFSEGYNLGKEEKNEESKEIPSAEDVNRA